MSARRTGTQETRQRRRPATTPEDREHQLVSAAHDLAEKQIEDGSASSQVITHFLKLGSSREILEQERMRHEVELLKVKQEAMARADRLEELMGAAIDAMRSYKGGISDDDEG